MKKKKKKKKKKCTRKMTMKPVTMFWKDSARMQGVRVKEITASKSFVARNSMLFTPWLGAYLCHSELLVHG